MPLTQAAQILKGELGLEGNVSDIVKQAASQLGIAADHQPLVEVAKQCLQKLGIGMVATAAVLEPDVAARTAPARTQAMASPPFTFRISRLHAIIMSSAMPPALRNSDIITKAGMVRIT